MPASKPPKRHRLRGLRVAEISLCTEGVNDHSRVVIAKADDDGEGASVAVELVAVDTDQRRVSGWAVVTEVDGVEVIDSQGDSISVDELREAAEHFVVNSRRGALRHGADHGIISWRQSVVVDDDLKTAWGIELDRSGWWVSGIVIDDDAWAAVKAGELRSLSIGGTASRAPVAKARPTRARTLNEILAATGYRDPVLKARIAPKATRAAKHERCTDCPNRGRTGTDDPCRSGCQMEIDRIVRKAATDRRAEAGPRFARERIAARSGTPSAAALAARAEAAEIIAKAAPTGPDIARALILRQGADRAAAIEKGRDPDTARATAPSESRAVRMARERIASLTNR